MKAMLVPTGEMPREMEIGDYKDIQQAVGGTFAAFGWIFDDAPTVYVNDDGKFACDPNRAVYARPEDAGRQTWGGGVLEEGDLIDIIYGDFVAIGFDYETGEERDISEEEAEKVMERFGTAESIDSGFLEAMRVKTGQARTAW